MTPIPSIRSLTLDLPPSCIAFCPTVPRLFVVGTYYLYPKQSNDNTDAEPPEDGHDSESPQKRSGGLELYRLDDDDDTITRIATHPTPEYSILDIHWTLHASLLGNLLAVATSTGSLDIYRLETGAAEAAGDASSRLDRICSHQICEPSILVLSLAWHPSRADTVGVTLSDGRVCICTSLAEVAGEPWGRGSKVEVREVHQHGLECWWMAWRSCEGERAEVLSGGDDVVLQCSSVSVAFDCSTDSIENRQEATTLWQDRKAHQAGVTAILPLGNILVLTGSYDDNIRLISAPSVGRRQVLAEENLGGGVWRLQILHVEPAHAPEASASASRALQSYRRSLIILASCMHAGTRVVRLTQSHEGKWRFDVLGKFEEHRSMNYGSGVQPTVGGATVGGVRRVVSTSFNDKLLCLWKFDVGGTASELMA